MTFSYAIGGLSLLAIANVWAFVRWILTPDLQDRLRAQANFASILLFMLFCIGVYFFQDELGRVAHAIARTHADMVR